MVSRIQEWAAEQWFNGPDGGTPITAERLSNVENQVEGIGTDLTALELAVAGIDINDPDFDAFIAALDPTMRDVVLGTGAYDLTNAALLDLIAANAPKTFRGAWAAHTFVSAIDFAGDVLPAGATLTGAGTKTIGAGNGGPNQPPGRVVTFSALGGGTGVLNVTVPNGITQLRWKWQTNGPYSGKGVGWNFSKNAGGTLLQYLTASDAWAEATASVAPGDVAKFSAHDAGTWGETSRIGYIEMLTQAVPYMQGQSVVYNGKLYQSAIDNNGSTPGADGNWTSLLTDAIPTTADIMNIVKITQAAYDALATKVATTLYVIVG